VFVEDGVVVTQMHLGVRFVVVRKAAVSPLPEQETYRLLDKAI
jgi:hypothetical protein